MLDLCERMFDNVAMRRVLELELPLAEAESEMSRRRLAHLHCLPGVGDHETAVLTRAFGSLADVYAAPEEELRKYIGAVAAARIRWFLDAPMQPLAVRHHVA